MMHLMVVVKLAVGKKLVDNEDDMITKAESRMLDLESSSTPVTLDIVKTKEAKI